MEFALPLHSASDLPREPALAAPRRFFNARVSAPVPGNPRLMVGEYSIQSGFLVGWVLVALTIPVNLILQLLPSLIDPLDQRHSRGYVYDPFQDPAAIIGVGFPVLGFVLMLACAWHQWRLLRDGPTAGSSATSCDSATLAGMFLLAAPVFLFLPGLMLLYADAPPAVVGIAYIGFVWASPILGSVLCIVGVLRERRHRRKSIVPGE